MTAMSYEEEKLPGLDRIDVNVRKKDPKTLSYKLCPPYIGWNDDQSTTENQLFNGFEGETQFYFLHSYYFRCIRGKDASTVSGYGGRFCCAADSGNTFGIQFRPEKSNH